ncbi:hypothetical protein HK099_008195, partial [Clydaea vesicula]
MPQDCLHVDICAKRFSTSNLIQSPFQKGPRMHYQSMLESKKLRPDYHQMETVEKLQNLYEKLLNYKPKNKEDGFSWKSLFGFGKKPVLDNGFPKGLYMYGDSELVANSQFDVTGFSDILYNSTSIPKKRRVHFHNFMQDIHVRIHELKKVDPKNPDPISKIADDLVEQAWFLCFDELQVTDISDAMILRRLFTELFNRGVIIVVTSNRHPDELYKNGIQRESFIPAIQLLKERLDVHTLDSGIDYRKEKRETYKVYFCPIDTYNQNRIKKIWAGLLKGNAATPSEIKFLGRSLQLSETYKKNCKVTFKEICENPLSSVDYLEFVKYYDTVVLTDVPKLTLSQKNEARRFITLIDALYENKVKLIMSTEVPIDQLFTGDEEDFNGRFNNIPKAYGNWIMAPEKLKSAVFSSEEEIFAFQRAVSRLTEMQSTDYLGKELKFVLENV